MRRGLTIGEFAQLTHLSVRTLRRYHEAGLLEPASVDAATGYRYYATAQIPDAQVIHRLRELDMPLADVKRILATEDPEARAELTAEHLRRLEAQLDRTRAAVASLRQLLRPDVERLAVELRSVPSRTVAAVRGTVAREDVLTWYAEAMSELDAAVAGHECGGPPGGVYDNELFTTGRGTMVIYRPASGFSPGGRVIRHVLPATELAVAVHRGPHDDIDVTYGRLGAWVVEHALAVDGPVHETYVRGPRDDAAPETWRTEIGWPVFRLSPVSGTPQRPGHN
ncbi:MerR family transcriptional regulator [Amycolatopsis thermophila]|uniref:DNA-binding transcriptional MerR regulator n=1 Tax=Amycolatopsis thermophila TaxID=206084 RepID=A0ABU0EX65_9PSEU|nr:MerR family transcriptional regulator [Amycolatopsis thermophila]MDQ0379907.1 DNA-binding transcriptional MerR regulator [Amycolatopsis thermophila]